MTPFINTVCLPPSGANFENQRCFTSGWGKDNFGKEGVFQAFLKKIEIPVIPRDTCEEIFQQTRLGEDFELHEGFLCAGKFFFLKLKFFE
jgi:plasma kallikrein